MNLMYSTAVRKPLMALDGNHFHFHSLLDVNELVILHDLSLTFYTLIIASLTFPDQSNSPTSYRFPRPVGTLSLDILKFRSQLYFIITLPL